MVAIKGVLQLGLAQMSLTNAIRLCQCSSITITSTCGCAHARGLQHTAQTKRCRCSDAPGVLDPARVRSARLPLQVDGEPFELEPIFAPRKALSFTVSHHNQAVMLSRSRVRSDGVALEAIDWAMQEGVITVDQRNQVVREIARRTGSLQRRALSQAASNLSLPSLG